MLKEQIVLFIGEEEYLIQNGLKERIERLLPETERDFNCQVIYGEDLAWDQWYNSASTWPFGSDKRLLVVKGIDASNAGVADKISEYLSHAAPSFLWAFFTAGKLTDKHPVYQLAKSAGTVVECRPWPESKLSAWIGEQAGALGVKLTPHMIRYILQEDGTSMLNLQQELRKISFFQKAKGEAIDSDELSLLIHGERAENVFALCDAVAGGKVARTFEIVDDLFRRGEAEVNMIGSLSRQFRQILAAKIIAGRGGQGDTLARKLNLHPYAAKLAFNLAKAFSLQQLVGIMEKLALYDEEMKNGKIQPKRGLNLLLFDLLLLLDFRMSI
ncbi:MAG: DNA polymerase III subunit delta [Bacillota bacterium]